MVERIQVKTFEVRIRRYDRREGLSDWAVRKIEAHSIPSAIRQAVGEFLVNITAKERRDAALSIEIKCGRLM
jgi:hypothetical protein